MLATNVLHSGPVIPSSVRDVYTVISALQKSTVCNGNVEQKYIILIQHKRGSMKSSSGTIKRIIFIEIIHILIIIHVFMVGGGIVSYLDTEKGSCPAVRHQKCSILVPKTKKRCLQCSVPHTPNILANRKQQANPEESSDPQSRTNYRYLSCPENGAFV